MFWLDTKKPLLYTFKCQENYSLDFLASKQRRCDVVTTLSTSKKRCINVKTTSCAYWEGLSKSMICKTKVFLLILNLECYNPYRLDTKFIFRIQITTNLKLRLHGIDEEWNPFSFTRFRYGFFSGTPTSSPSLVIFRAACVIKRDYLDYLDILGPMLFCVTQLCLYSISSRSSEKYHQPIYLLFKC